MSKITPGEGNTLKKITDNLYTLEEVVKNLDELAQKINNIYIHLGLSSEGETAAGEINVDTTRVTSDESDEGSSTLRDTVHWDDEGSQWKFYSILRPYTVSE